MRYLIRPNALEELYVRGRYEWRGPAGEVRAREWWEHYRSGDSPVQIWRSEWEGEHRGRAASLRSHALVSERGIERLKLRWAVEGKLPRPLTITTEPDEVLLNDGRELRELAMPPGYGIVTPLPSLARFAFPIELAAEGPELAMTLLLRPDMTDEGYGARPTKFAYRSLGLAPFELRGEPLRGRGWRMEVPGLPPREAWFDRNGHCLAYRDEGQMAGLTAQLVEWLTFG